MRPQIRHSHRTFADFLASMPLMNVEVERCDGQAMKLPIVPLGETCDWDSMPCTSELLNGVETRPKRLIEMNGKDELMVQQSKNKSFLISSFDTPSKADKAKK